MKLKKITCVFTAFILCVFLLASCTDKKDVYKAPASTDEVEGVSKVTLCVYVEDEDRYIAENTIVDAKEGETVFDVLLKVIKENKIHIDYEGTDKSAYVKGIDSLYSGDKGENSAWLFYVNNKRAETGAGSIEVKDGDIIEWKYVLDWQAAE